MRWLFDTNVLSELRHRDAERSVVAWAEAQNPFDVYLSVMTVFELEVGVARKERSDPRQGAELRRWIAQLVDEQFAGRILPLDTEIARLAAGLHAPDPRPDKDAFIAATALRHNLTVVTRNVKDFAPLGVRVLDPWTAG